MTKTLIQVLFLNYTLVGRYHYYHHHPHDHRHRNYHHPVQATLLPCMIVRNRSLLHIPVPSEQSLSSLAAAAAANNTASSTTHSSSTLSPRAAQNSSSMLASIASSQTSRRCKLFILFMLAAGLVYVWLGFSIQNNAQSRDRVKHNYNGKLTVVINTFKRNDMMLEAIDYYSSCEVVKHIYIIWSETVPPPGRISAKYEKSRNPSVVFRQESVDSLNSRFRPLTDPHTDAIFSVDDDMRVPCKELGLAYEVWLNSPNTIVGFMPRLHLRNGSRYEYRCWWRVWWHGAYSIVLTKAAILHHRFFELYSSSSNEAVRALVDSRRNCEDIAMQFLVSNETSLPPIYVKGHLEDRGVLAGISTSQNILDASHMKSRSKCLDELVRIYKHLPLVKSHVIVDSASNPWSNTPSTIYEYFSSDLWKW